MCLGMLVNQFAMVRDTHSGLIPCLFQAQLTTPAPCRSYHSPHRVDTGVRGAPEARRFRECVRIYLFLDRGGGFVVPWYGGCRGLPFLIGQLVEAQCFQPVAFPRDGLREEADAASGGRQSRAGNRGASSSMDNGEPGQECLGITGHHPVVFGKGRRCHSRKSVGLLEQWGNGTGSESGL